MTRLYTLAALATLISTPALAQQPIAADADPLATQVSLRISPPSAVVMLDGATLDARDTLYLSEGTHTLRIEAPGYIPRVETLHITAQHGREILMSVNLSAEPVAPSSSIRSEGIVDQMDYGRPITGWIMTAGGAALITTSIILAVRGSVPSTYTEEQGIKEAPRLAGWSAFTGVLGGASLLGGITLLSWHSLAGEPQTAGLAAESVRLSVSGSGVLLRLDY